MSLKSRAWALSALAAFSLATSACHDHDDDVVLVIEPGIVVADLQSIADYLDNEVVQVLLDRTGRNAGGSPPDVAGRYDADGTIIANVGPQNLIGDDAIAQFCLGTAAGASLDVEVIEATAVDGGARSFIEGSGDEFTVYTAFKSVQLLANGDTCELHLVNVYSGTLEADGSFSDFRIGQGIVGLIGNCGNALVGDYQITAGIATRTADSCSSDPAPGTGDLVLVEIENNLVTDVAIFLDGGDESVLVVPALSVGSFETEAGFALDFENIPPVAGQDDDGFDIEMGEIIGGIWPTDGIAPGDGVRFCADHVIGDDTFFAPLPLNQSSHEIFSVVNAGVPIDFYPEPIGSGLDCLCAMPPDAIEYVVGYYSYDVPGVIAASESNVRFFNVANEAQLLASFEGPFALEAGSSSCTAGGGSGTVVLRVD